MPSEQGKEGAAQPITREAAIDGIMAEYSADTGKSDVQRIHWWQDIAISIQMQLMSCNRDRNGMLAELLAFKMQESTLKGVFSSHTYAGSIVNQLLQMEDDLAREKRKVKGMLAQVEAMRVERDEAREYLSQIRKSLSEREPCGHATHWQCSGGGGFYCLMCRAEGAESALAASRVKAELLELIDRKAEAGLCYYTLTSAREFLKDIRKIVAAALATQPAPQAAYSVGDRIAYERYPGSVEMTTGVVVRDGSDGTLAYATNEAHPPEQIALQASTRWWPLQSAWIPAAPQAATEEKNNG